MGNASGQSNCNGSTSSLATIAHPARYAVLEFETLLDSSSIDSKGWAEIAQTIFRNYKLFDGFVVLHGTDSLAYTCSALSFMLQNLGKPVIVTGLSKTMLRVEKIPADGSQVPKFRSRKEKTTPSRTCSTRWTSQVILWSRRCAYASTRPCFEETGRPRSLPVPLTHSPRLTSLPLPPLLQWTPMWHGTW